MFLEKGYEGKRDVGRWIAMVLIVIVLTQLIGGLPLAGVIFLRMMDNPDIVPNPDNPLDLSAYGIDPSLGLALMVFPFILGFVSLLLLMKPIHERGALSVITASPKFRWRRFFEGAIIWFVLMSIYSLIASTTGLQKVELQFNPNQLIPLVFVSLILLPFQTGFEELFFRGYLMQAVALIFRSKWVPLAVTAILFGSLHIFNPEVKAYGMMVTLPQYIWFGLFFGICTLMDEGLELAWGVHAINNIFLSVFFTQDSSALQTPALFKVTEMNPLTDLIALLILSAIFLLIAWRRYHWPFISSLFAPIDAPTISMEEESFGSLYGTDEYENE